ncbi:MAG: zincin-like metallopeptidase domain-containing protein [Nodosilinea sp.]
MAKRKAQSTDKFQLLTDKILTLMESGTTPWVKPWHSTPYANAISGHCYRGMNPIIATVDVMIYGYKTPLFVGFSQAKNLNWKIIKGSKATWLLWGGKSSKEVVDEVTGEVQKQFFNSFKWLNVFNLDCVDDSEAEVKKDHYLKKYHLSGSNTEPRLDLAEEFIAAQNAKVQFGGDMACYSSDLDRIRMPDYSDFTSAEAYYATFAHELSHWSGHSSRLDRKLGNKFGSQAYAFEELIAELSAAFICNELAINSQIENHASYLANWIQILKSDSKAFLQAASQAQKASKYLLSNVGMMAEGEAQAA